MDLTKRWKYIVEDVNHAASMSLPSSSSTLGVKHVNRDQKECRKRYRVLLGKRAASKDKDRS
jgi:hypothetical protein